MRADRRHTHDLGQTLHIMSGIALVQAHGGLVIEARPGDTVHTSPGEEHWHGAAPGAFMEHLALWGGPRPGRRPGDRVGRRGTSARPARPIRTGSTIADFETQAEPAASTDFPPCDDTDPASTRTAALTCGFFSMN